MLDLNRLVISVNLLVLVLSMSVSSALHNPGILNPFDTSASVFKASLIVTAVGGVLTIAELVSLIFLFEKIKSGIKNITVVSLLYIGAFILVLCLDGLIFPLILMPEGLWVPGFGGAGCR